MTTANPSFSVILNTIDREGPLQTVLKALEHQSYSNFEVVVVVGPTRDGTLDKLVPYQNRVRIIRCPTANLSRSRNLGLLAAGGDIVIYLDDDAVPCQRWLEQYVAVFEDKTVDCVGGAVWAASPRFSMLQFQTGIYSSLSEQVDVRHSWLDSLIPAGKASHWISRTPGGNMALRRGSLLDMGGFDEFYEFVAEEADLCLRMVNAGKNLVPVKEAIIYHLPASGRNRVAFTNKGRWWMRSRSRIYLGIKSGSASGETRRAIFERTILTMGSHLPWYFNLFRAREFGVSDLLSMTFHEFSSASVAIFYGLFKPRQLIQPADIEKARRECKPVQLYQNEESGHMPSVDPVSGRTPNIRLPDPPLRLCLLSNSYPPAQVGGIATLTNLMAKGLFELGHTVHVITRGDRETVQFYDGAYVHSIPNRMDRYKAYQPYYNLFSTLNYSHAVFEKVQKLILNDGIQLVDSPIWQYEGLVTQMSGRIPVVVRLVTGIRQIMDIHNNHVDDIRLMGDLEEIFLQKADFIMPNTQATFNAIQKVYQFDAQPDRCSIVPYGIIPAPEDQVQPYQRKPEDCERIVLFVGRLEKRKGILDLFEAIPSILKQYPDARFVLVGADNSEHDGFRTERGMTYPQYFASHYAGYLSKVEFKGQVSDDDLQMYYKSCDLFVAPSLYESFGLIYLEAMNFAKPVIGCLAGGIPEVVDDGITGLLVEPNAPAQLAQAVVSLLKSPAKLREMGLAGRNQIRTKFNYLQMARNFEKVYRKVIFNPEPRQSTPAR